MNMKWVDICLVAGLLLLSSACATKANLPSDNVDQNLTPSNVIDNIDQAQGKQILWGGVIVSGQNRKQGTALEILAYPINQRFHPDTKKTPYGRFLAEYPHYLEMVDYAPGRLVSLVGTVSTVRDGQIGETTYHYPVIHVEQLHLWKQGSQSETRFYFGLGVMFHD